MAERRKNKKKLDRGGSKDEEKEQMTKQQKSVVSWLKKNVPTKKTKFMHSHVVEYFSSSKALDALMNDSPWAPEKAKEGADLKFEFREQAIDYMDDLLRLNMFHRAKDVNSLDLITGSVEQFNLFSTMHIQNSKCKVLDCTTGHVLQFQIIPLNYTFVI